MISIDVYALKQYKVKSDRINLEGKIARSPATAYTIVQEVLDIEHEASEMFGIVCLTQKNGVAGIHVVSIGSLDAAIVHPREVFKRAILNNAASIICFHNHPSGDPTPSPADLELTKRLVDSGELLGIQVLDHLIIGEGRYISLMDQGLM